MKSDLQKEILRKLRFSEYAINKLLSNVIITKNHDIVGCYPDSKVEEIDYDNTHYYVIFLNPNVFD